MSKSDEIRRMRELQHAQRERAASGGAKGPVSSSIPASSPSQDAEAVGGFPVAVADAPSLHTETRARGGAEEQGKCSGCGKVRALVNGLIVMHQKGLGKVCPGARKVPT